MSFQKTMNGFTLIEAIIVVAVMAILAAIAIPIYSQYVADAKQSACVSEVKSYSNQVFYTLNDQDDSTVPISPVVSACQSITDTTGWTLETQQKIFANAKPPSNARMECDVPNGSPCRVVP